MNRGTEERGSVTLWLLGLGICLLVVGGMGLDLWSVVATRARLVGVAEAIAIGAASGLSEEHWRRTGEVRLDPVRAERLGRDLAAGHPGAGLLDGPVEILVGSDSVTVTVTGSVPLTLLALAHDSDHVAITVTATSRPHLVG